MAAFLPFLRARLAERSSRLQLVIMVLLAAIAAGLFTFDDLNEFTTKILAALPVLGMLAGVIVPDKNHDVTAAAEADVVVGVALNVATEAAEKAAGPEATALARNVGAVVDKLGL